jgi:heat shock protein HtpX
MQDPVYTRHRIRNLIQTTVLIVGMMGVLGLSAHLIFGEKAFFWAAGMMGLALVLAPRISPAMVLRMYGARPLDPREAPQLHRIVEALARRAGLENAPRLYRVHSTMMNAFAVGDRRSAAIAVTDGLLANLSLRELAAVLGHEIAHVRNGDLHVMMLADLVTRITDSLSLTGQILILVNLPLLAAAGYTISWTGLLLLVFAPTISALLQLALSRTREFDADLEAARLTGDPQALASALDKLERMQAGWIERIFTPMPRIPDPSLLRTHPPTEERIRRLMELDPRTLPPPLLATAGPVVYTRPQRDPPPPRRHFPGVWY